METMDSDVQSKQREGELPMTNSARPVKLTHTEVRVRRVFHQCRMLAPTLAIILGTVLIFLKPGMAAELSGVALVAGGVWHQQ